MNYKRRYSLSTSESWRVKSWVFGQVAELGWYFIGHLNSVCDIILQLPFKGACKVMLFLKHSSVVMPFMSLMFFFPHLSSTLPILDQGIPRITGCLLQESLRSLLLPEQQDILRFLCRINEILWGRVQLWHENNLKQTVQNSHAKNVPDHACSFPVQQFLSGMYTEAYGSAKTFWELSRNVNLWVEKCFNFCKGPYKSTWWCSWCFHHAWELNFF